jgi:hypothetical protein
MTLRAQPARRKIRPSVVLVERLLALRSFGENCAVVLSAEIWSADAVVLFPSSAAFRELPHSRGTDPALPSSLETAMAAANIEGGEALRGRRLKTRGCDGRNHRYECLQ